MFIEKDLQTRLDCTDRLFYGVLVVRRNSLEEILGLQPLSTNWIKVVGKLITGGLPVAWLRGPSLLSADVEQHICIQLAD